MNAGGPRAHAERRFRVSLRWAFLMNSGQRLVGMASTFALAAILGPHDFGLVAMAMVYVALIQVLLEQGISTALIQRQHLEREHLDSGFWMTLLWSLALGGLAVGLSGFWAAANREPELALLVKVLSILLPIQGLVVVQQAKLQREMRFKPLALRTNVAALAGAASGIPLAVLGVGVWALVAQELATATVGLVLLWAVSGWVPSRRFSRRHARDLLGFSLHAFAGNLGSFVNRRSDALLIGLFLGPTVVGLYRLADRLIEGLVSIVTRPVQLVSLPHFSRLQQDRAALQDAVTSCVRLTALTTVPAMLGVVALSDYLTDALGSEWRQAADALKLLALVGIGKAIILFTGPLLYAVARPQIRTAMVWALAAASAGSFATAGVVLADATVASQVLGTAGTRALLFTLVFIPVNLVVVARFTGISVKALLPPFVAPTAAGLVALGVVTGLGAAGTFAWLPAPAALVAAAATATVATVAALAGLRRRARSARLPRRRRHAGGPVASPEPSLPDPADAPWAEPRPL
ncbi:MAG: lipopolysaccharide biosynthesis protein [Thermoleophilia bacterium]|nr:lipopolysaccharide biosynthesis protein [Thermoleophilia bacterium]